MAGIKTALEQTEDCAITENCETETPQLDFVSDNVLLKAGEKVKEGARDDTVFKKCVFWFKQTGLSKNDVEVLAQNFNKQKCEPPLPVSEVSKIVESASRYRTQVVGVTLPPIEKAIIDPEKVPPKPPELIKGVLTKGAYMALVGASKMGKSFLLIDLAVCIQNGLKWLGFQCAKGKVLYINLEIQGAQFFNRVNDIYRKYNNFMKFDAFDIWNLRGYDVAIERLQAELDTLDGYDVFIIDPQYKINTGDENSASEQGAFFNHIDHIATTNNTSVIICHHHSKGKQTNKRAIDRASGSGVMGRAVDALLDITHIENVEPPSKYEGAKAIVLTPELRDFPEFEPIGLWWSYPYHYKDETGAILYGLAEEGGQQTTTAKIEFYTNAIEELIEEKGEACLSDLIAKTGKCRNTVKDWVEKLDDYKFEGENAKKSPLIVRVSK